MVMFLTGYSAMKTDTAKVGSVIVSCPLERINCPLLEAKKRAILTKLRESGDPEAIEKGKVEMYRIHDGIRLVAGADENARALEFANAIYIDPDFPDAVATASVAHEGAHAFDKSPKLTHADKLRRERKAFDKQADVWEALKKRDPSLKNEQNDDIVKFRRDGALDEMIIRKYGLSL